MKKYIKYFISIFIFILIAIFFKWCSTGFITQKHLSEHPFIGKKIQFSQPISYVISKHPSIVPIVNEIKKDLIWIHPKDDSEKENVYILSHTIFTITDVYTYKDIVNPQKYYYVLSNNKSKFIIDDFSFKILQKPIYKNAQMPINELDKLYKNKLYGTLKIRFYLNEKIGRYYDLFSITPFNECNIQNIVTNNNGIIATVNFNQLSCLYSKLWHGRYSKEYPVKYEILE